MFNIVIQLGAILAIVVLYWRTFWVVLTGLFARDALAIRFVRNILVAFVPAAVIGLVLHKKIEALLGQPVVVAVALVVGGIAIIGIERLVKPGAVRGVGRGADRHRRRHRLHPMSGDGARGKSIGRDDPGGAGARRRTADRGRIQLFPRDPDDAWRDDA